jgi:hypothetical protein
MDMGLASYIKRSLPLGAFSVGGYMKTPAQTQRVD